MQPCHAPTGYATRRKPRSYSAALLIISDVRLLHQEIGPELPPRPFFRTAAQVDFLTYPFSPKQVQPRLAHPHGRNISFPVPPNRQIFHSLKLAAGFLPVCCLSPCSFLDKKRLGPLSSPFVPSPESHTENSVTIILCHCIMKTTPNLPSGTAGTATNTTIPDLL